LEKFVVTGGRPLEGEVNINGAKNSVVAIIPAAILVDGPCTIENIPNINDVKTLISILKDLGAEIKFESKDTLSINSQNIKSYTATYDMVKCLRRPIT